MTNRVRGAALALFGLAAATVAAQDGGSIGLLVQETAGIRRTEYPVSTRLTLPRGAVSDLTHLRLRAGDTEIVGQYAAGSKWDDGSMREVEADFNLSTAAGESRAVRVEFGAGVTPEAKPRGGLAVTEDADAIQVGSVKFGKRGWPLLASIAYRGEIVGQGPNGLTLTDAAGARHEFGTARAVAVDVVKRGPLLVVIRYTGRVPLDGGVEVPVTITCEMPNSKSWIKLSASVDDPGRRVRGVFFETPFALGAHPWTWDFGTDSGTYGVFRTPADTALFTQVVTPGGNQWRAETGTPADRRVYEQSVPGRATTAAGWGHLLDTKNAIAFAMDRFAAAPGTYTLSLTGEGQVAFGFTRAQPAANHQLTVYQHYVGTPVAIGAATSPASMVKPLVVTEEKESGVRRKK